MNRRDHELAAYDHWLRRMARRLARSSARADDLVQDTYMTALRNAPVDAELRPWLRAVMRKLAWGQLRSERRRFQREQGYSLMEPGLALHEALREHDIDRERLAAALAALAEPFHSTLVERFLHGRSCADIARTERVPAGTVRWRQARALEMLRAELKIRRRQRAVLALPFLGAGGHLVARVWHTLTAPGISKAIGLPLTLLALIFAFRGKAVSPHASPPGIAVARAEGADAELAEASPGSRDAPDAPEGDARRAGAADRVVRQADALAGLLAALGPAVASARDAGALASSDGARDARSGAEPSPPAAVTTEALCALVRQHILAAQAIATASPAARPLLRAAMLANRAVATQLGCPVATPAPGIDASGGGAGCVTQVSADGAACTRCPGERPVCAPAECQSRLRDDGVVCTTCVDKLGEKHSDCGDQPPVGCRSELADSGLLCTSCDGGPAECLPAECGVIDRCLRCVDPRGHVGVDCSVDYEALRSGSYGTSADNLYLSSCRFQWGVIQASGTTCHYPGPQSCTVIPGDDWHCLQCQYPDGSGTQVCMAASEPLPDPMMLGRPADLPPPGTCSNELGSDGSVACSTCTRADLSATTSCHYAGIESCEFGGPASSDPGCMMSCRRLDGSRVAMCNSPRGPLPR